MLGRINDVQPAGQHRDGAPARLDHLVMGHAINASSQPTHHGDAGVYQIAGHGGGCLLPVGGSAAGPHDGDGTPVIRENRSLYVEHWRRVVYLLKAVGVFLVAPCNCPYIGLGQSVHLRIGRDIAPVGYDLAYGATVQPRCLESALPSTPSSLQGTKVPLQLSEAHGPQMRDAVESHPILDVSHSGRDSSKGKRAALVGNVAVLPLQPGVSSLRKTREKAGGEGGIRTHEPGCPSYALSRRACSATPAPLRGTTKSNHIGQSAPRPDLGPG